MAGVHRSAKTRGHQATPYARSKPNGLLEWASRITSFFTGKQEDSQPLLPQAQIEAAPLDHALEYPSRPPPATRAAPAARPRAEPRTIQPERAPKVHQLNGPVPWVQSRSVPALREQETIVSSSTVGSTSTSQPPVDAEATLVNTPLPPGFGGKATTQSDILDYMRRHKDQLDAWELLSLQKLLREHWIKFMDPLKADGIDWVIREGITKKDPHLASTIKSVMEPRQQFHFTTQLPEAPRERTESQSTVASGFSTSTDASSASQPVKKTLKHNPTSAMRWNGVASAKPARYRRATTVSAPPVDASRVETHKRRRTDSGGNTGVGSFSLTSSTAPTSSPALPASQRPVHVPNGRLGGPAPPVTPIKAKSPAAPVNPSPLRQMWSPDRVSSSPGSPHGTLPAMGSPAPSSTGSQTHGRPTRTAEMLAEMIKDATPPVRPTAVQNPYETAALVKPGPRKPSAARKRRDARAEKAPKPESEPEPEPPAKETPMSPQAIIELTVPKGSKRARPPPDLAANKDNAQANGSPLRRSTRVKSPELASASMQSIPVNGTSKTSERKQAATNAEVTEQEEVPAAKRVRKGKELRNTLPLPDGPLIEEMETDDVPTSGDAALVHPVEIIEPDSPAGKDKSATNGLAPDAKRFTPSARPRQPSKLRYSYAAEEKEKEEAAAMPPPAATSKSAFAAPKPFTPLPVVEEKKAEDEQVKSDNSFASFASSWTPPPLPTAFKPADAPASSAFNFLSSSASKAASSTITAPSDVSTTPLSTSAATPLSTSAGTPTPAQDPKVAARSMAVTALPAFDFSFKPGESSKTMLGASPAVVTQAKSKPAASLPAFDFTSVTTSTKGKGKSPAGLGLGRPGASAEPAVVKLGTPTTEAPAVLPATAVHAAPAVFNWAAAGLKPQASSGWTCSTCMVSNKQDAPQCISCEEPKPGAAKAAPTPAAAGFDWAAAGMKPKAASGWTCGTCMVPNKTDATQCAACEEPRPGVAKAAPPSAPSPVTAPTTGFNWAAAGMKPQAKSGWTCGTCMVSNKEDATQCISCEEPRPGAKAAPAPASTGFNWAAAGMKPPAAAGWTCSVCMVPNKADAKKCISCEEDKP